MAKKLPEPELHYVWREPRVNDEGDVRLIVPRADANEHEHPFDLLFDTPVEAIRALNEWEIEPVEYKEWVLCIHHVTPALSCESPILPDENTWREVKLKISLDKQSSSWAIFAGFTCLEGFYSYIGDHNAALAVAKARVKQISNVEPEVVYPEITKMVTS